MSMKLVICSHNLRMKSMKLSVEPFEMGLWDDANSDV
jgi:hypothetical protein